MALDPLKIYIIAGEPSGDQMGAKIIESLKSINPKAKIYGIGGMKMQEQGLKSLFPMEELSIMGVWGIIKDLPNLLGRIGETVRDINQLRPDVVLTIDSPEFSFRVQKGLKKLKKLEILPDHVKQIHLVAPTVWAWRPGRAKKIAKFLDKLLCIYPFEPPLFEKWGLESRFVGHPLAEVPKGDGEAFRKRHSINKSSKLIALLPGSRKSEIKVLLPIFLEAAKALRESHTNLKFIIPTLDKNKALVEGIIKNRHCEEGQSPGVEAIQENLSIVTSDPEFHDAIAAADLALAASGTVALELAMAETPMVIAYKLTSFPRSMMKILIKTPWVSMVNILLNKSVVPELLQEDCNVQNCTCEMEKLLTKDGSGTQKSQISKIKGMLLPSKKPPEQLIAEEVLLAPPHMAS